jgi:hypothetical protein
MARVVRFHKTGGPEVFQIEEIDLPKPGLGEVQHADVPDTTCAMSGIRLWLEFWSRILVLKA